MEINIRLDVDVDDLNASAIDDLIADWTYEMRVTRRLRSGSWRISYDASCGCGSDD